MKNRRSDDEDEFPLMSNGPASRNDEDMPGQGRALSYEFLLRYQAWVAAIAGTAWVNRLGRKLQVLPLGKDLMLMISGESTWDRIAASRRGWLFTTVYYLIPTLIMAGLAEGIGLFFYGQGQVARGLTMERYSGDRLAVFELVQAGGFLCLILSVALCLKSFGNACHARNQLREGLLVMTHALGPLLFLQAFNGIPGMSVWITWIPGVILVIASLYHGLPRIMRPDAPSAMGLFVAGSAVVFLLCLLWRLLTYWYFTGDFKAMDRLITSLADRLTLF